ARRAATQAFTAAEHLHVGRDDLGRVLFDAVLVLPLARLQPSLHIDRAALLQVLAGDLGELVVEDDAMPLGLLGLVARFLVLPAARRRDADVADGAAVRRIAHFR